MLVNIEYILRRIHNNFQRITFYFSYYRLRSAHWLTFMMSTSVSLEYMATNRIIERFVKLSLTIRELMLNGIMKADAKKDQQNSHFVWKSFCINKKTT